MAIEYINGAFYDMKGAGTLGDLSYTAAMQDAARGYRTPVGIPLGGGVATQPSQQSSGMYQDPFGSAMSGGMKGTLQPYVNRMTQNASNALYGGLLDYQPQSMIAGNAGGTPVNSQVPDWKLSGGLLGNGQIGQRAWMGKQNGAT